MPDSAELWLIRVACADLVFGSSNVELNMASLYVSSRNVISSRTTG